MKPVHVEPKLTMEQRAHRIERDRVLAHIEAAAGRRDCREVIRWAIELRRLVHAEEVVMV